MPSAVPGAPHIIGDAMKYRFPKNSIQNAYLERFPTFEPNAQLYLTDKDQYKNYLSKCVENVGPSIISGGKMIIEWEPFLSMHCHGTDHSSNIHHLYDPNALKKDPFTADIDINIAWIGTSMEMVNHISGAKKSFKLDPQLSTSSIRCIKELSATIKTLLNSYEKQRPGTRAKICRHIETELQILNQLLNSKPKQVAILFCSPLDGMKNFHSANHDTFTTTLADHPLVCNIKNFPHFLAKDPLRLIQFLNAFTHDKPHFTIPFDGSKIVIYDANSFTSDSLFFRILAKAFTLHKKVQDNIKNFMQKNNFKNVEITPTGTSPYNGRRNVTLISATKK